MDIKKPVLSFLPLVEDQGVLNALGYYAQALDSLLCIGTHLLNWEHKATTGDPEKNGVVIAIFRRILEVLDSGSVLIENGCIVPAKTMLRILMELVFQFEFLLKDKSQISKKVLYFLIMELDNRLETRETWQKDLAIRRTMPALENEIQDLKDKIRMSHFDPVRAVYQSKVFKTNGERKKTDIKWYSLAGNISSVRWLAENLDRKHYHHLVYCEASNVVHSSNLFEDSLYQADGKLYIRKIRDANQAKDLIMALIRVTTDAYRIMLSRRKKEQKSEYLYGIQEFKNLYKNIIPVGASL